MLSLPKIHSKRLRRFGRSTSGAAAVEFGLVAPWFFLLLFGLGEVGLMGFAQTSLDHAVSDVSRRIRTGQSQGANESYQTVKDALCAEMNNLGNLDCTTNLFLDVDTFASYVDVTNTSPISGGALNTSGFGYTPGASSSIVVVRAYYQWHVLTPFFQGVFGNVGNGQDRLLVSTMMFRNEPY